MNVRLNMTDKPVPDPQQPKPVQEDPTVRNAPMPQPSLSPAAPTVSGQKCPTCGFMNRVGVLVCENCGTNLISGEQGGPGTRQLKEQGSTSEQKSERLSTQEMQAVKSAGTNIFEDTMVLRLEINGAQNPLLIYPKAETSLGRRDPATGTMPDVDLTTYAGYRMGVSRRHAIIRLNNKRLEIYDLGSSNGTAVNGVRLAPHQPYPLRDGDEIMLGKMSLRAIFQTGSRKP